MAIFGRGRPKKIAKVVESEEPEEIDEEEDSYNIKTKKLMTSKEVDSEIEQMQKKLDELKQKQEAEKQKEIEETEEPKDIPEDLRNVLLSHEQRIVALEAFIFRNRTI